ncbi:MAG TPA: hypothetical protein VK507_02185 [Iamia sp.]|nr:hypothetical protein [Iamia sp.]
MGQNVVLLTKEVGDDERSQEMVVGIEVDGERFDVPMDSRIAVESEAGATTQLVTLTLFADTVRYAPAEVTT